MVAIAIVSFREFLEIALLLGVILAVTKPIINSGYYVLLGVVLGVVLALCFAFSASFISEMFEGFGDEIFDSGIILLSAFIISWTVIWMQGYAKKIKRGFSVISDKISSGTNSKLILTLLVATTILREGAEIMLFTYSISQAENINLRDDIFGFAVGASVGLLVGCMIYHGLISVARQYVFKISTVLLILIAAGLSSQAAGVMTSTGILSSFSDQLWDTSWLVSDQSIFGKILNALIGYHSRPNGMQIIFYITTIFFNVIMITIKKMFITKNHA